MEPILRHVLVLSFLFLMSSFYRIFRVRWRRRHATDIELGWYRSSIGENELHGISLVAPFTNYRVDENITGTPPPDMTDILCEVLKDYQLVQLVIGGCLFPVQEYIYDIGLRTFRNRVSYDDGVLVYSPESIRKGALASGITSELDLFLIVRSDCSSFRERLRQDGGRLGIDDRGIKIDNTFDPTVIEGCEGYFINQSENWTFFHKNPEMIDELLDRTFEAGYRTLFSINRLPYPESVKFPLTEMLEADKTSFADKPTDMLIYFEDKEVVTYIRSGKKWAAKATSVSLLHSGMTSRLSRSALLRWILPEIVQDRAYRRKNLFRFSLQYFLTACYLFGFIAGLITLSESVLTGVSDIWFMIPTFLCSLLSVMSLILSFSYLVRALFGGKHLLRPGI
ncbi:MAG: hypothetical protein ACOYVF_11730 [Candidatus Zixiibacteriota bacterium]